MISEFNNQIDLIAKEVRETWNENMSLIITERACGDALEILACLNQSIKDISDDILSYLTGDGMPKQGWVYLMQYKSGLFKIGFSDTPPRRQNQLWGKPEIIHVIETDDMVRLENRVHELFDSKRQGQELFALSQEDVNSFMTVKNVFYADQTVRHLSLF